LKRGDRSRDVGQHLIDMSKLVASEVACGHICRQPGLNQLEIVDVSAIGPIALISHRDIVVPKPAFENAGGVIERFRNRDRPV
jgi:hypothetical protein